MNLKKLIVGCALLFGNTLFAQLRDTAFSKQWIEIDSLIGVSKLPKSALVKVKDVYSLAEKKSNNVHQLKALLYRVALENDITETDINRNTASLQKELAKNKDADIQALLHVLIAKQYQEYFNNHRWQLYQRSNISLAKKEDILSWSADDFLKAIETEYFLSLKNKALLKKTSVTKFDVLLYKGDAEYLRPTLFDLIAHDALDYFKTGEGSKTRPINDYSIQQREALSGYTIFSNTQLNTSDSSAHAFKALQLFQELIRFHESDSNKAALILVDVDRINWVSQQVTFENKKQLKAAALHSIATAFKSDPASAHAMLQLAKDKAELAESFIANIDTTNRFSYQEALLLIAKIEQLYQKENPVKDALENLKQDILRKSLSTESEMVNIPGKPFRALVKFKNVDTIFIRIIAIALEETSAYNNRDTIIYRLCNSKPMISFKHWLPNTDDHQDHRVEIKLDPLLNGEYILFTSSGKDFNKDSDILNYQPFQISNISLVQNKNNFFVLNRETGMPIPKATINVLSQTSYQYNLPWNAESKATTDENGYFKLTTASNNNYYRFDIESKNDRLRIFNNSFISGSPVDNTDNQVYEMENEKTFFFTDRSIYRPGQTVLFKSIVTTLEKATNRSKIVAHSTATVYLKDANYRIVDSLKFTSNDYGSFTGKFVLPEKLLTGNFTLSLKKALKGEAMFSVEAYKRPTYTASFEKLIKPYRLNDSIEVKGIAKAFAGNFITGAKVSYHIVRKARPMYFYLRYNNFRYSPPQEIGQGSLQTDSKGAFIIRFKALPDMRMDSNSNPIFDYTIDATVTDPSGETRTTTKKISCSYQSLLLQVSHPQIINANQETKIGITASNLNEEIQSALVNIKLVELQAPERLIRDRYWSRPDQFVMSKDDYIKSFPFDLYDNENEFNTYPVARTAIETTIDTKHKNEFFIDKAQLKSGYYQIIASTKDEQGKLVEYKNYLQVFDPQNNSLASGNIHFMYGNSSPMEPGEKDTIYSGSMAKELFVIRHIQKQHQKDAYSFINTKKGIEPFVYSANEQDRGGIQIGELSVFQNRVFVNNFTKPVPFTNKELAIKYASFRNNTEPGSDEKWTVEISGKKGEKTAAELLTTMYDASLDDFKSHQLNRPNWWTAEHKYDTWSFNSNVGNQNSTTHFIHDISWNTETDIIYDRIPYNFEDLWNISYNNHLKLKEKPFINSPYGFGSYNPLAKMDNSFALNEIVTVGAGVQSKTIRLSGANTINPMAAPPPALKDEDHNKVNHNLEDNLDQKTALTTETQIRKNFNETAFFFPQLYADSTGTYRFSFTMPDAVTKWKWMSFAHTKDLSSGMQSAYIQTQKTLMVQSNAPRFMREGDKMEFSTRIANMSDKELTGQITLELVDATTNTSVDGWFQNIFPTQYFTVGAKQTEAIKFPIQIPFSYNKPLIWRVVAKSGNYSDGEENVLAVLSNRSLITESLPILVKGDTTQQFHFTKLLNQNSSSLTNESLIIEFSSNPIWYAVQALPFLKQGMDNCAEAIFNRIYANSIAAYIVGKNPIIKTWFEQSKKDTASLLSNLQKNQQLKQVLLEETPWVLAANTEAERKKNLAELFDLLKLAESNQSSLAKLQELQLPNGAFSWFKGGYEDPYITTYILTGIGKLKILGALTPDQVDQFRPMLIKAIQYADEKINSAYQWLISHSIDLNLKHIGSREIQYLYMRSFFADIVKKTTTASNYYFKQSKINWKQFSVYYQSMIGLIQLRNKDEQFVGKTLLPSIFENAVTDTQKGMYWKQTAWDWYSSPIETAALVIELTSEYNQKNNSLVRTKEIDEIKTWLILNKQTNNWKTSIKTANACYALLLNGTDWLKQQKTVQVTLGKTVINSSNEKIEAGSGYFEKRIDGPKVDPTMGEIKLTTKTAGAQKNNQPAWGAIYWQYFEDYDKITEAASPLTVQKKIMIETVTAKGKELVPVDLNNPLKVGDKVVIRMLIRTDRDMEYLHLKDMRAAGMEPVNVLSGYKWQDGMGYYENTTDISSNFFISHMNKGTYVFEYPVYITHTGNFSVGIASIQCMYAPEFNSHSEGIRINVAE